MKRRKFGVSFEKDIVYIKYIFGHYEIKYSDIEKIVYIKRSFRNNLIEGSVKEVAQVQIHLDLVI